MADIKTDNSGYNNSGYNNSGYNNTNDYNYIATGDTFGAIVGGNNQYIGTNSWSGTFTTTIKNPPKTLQDLVDHCNSYTIDEEEFEWLEFNMPLSIDLVGCLIKIEPKLNEPFSPFLKRKIRKMKMEIIKSM